MARKRGKVTHDRIVGIVLDCMSEQLTSENLPRTKRAQRKAFHTAVDQCRRVLHNF